MIDYPKRWEDIDNNTLLSIAPYCLQDSIENRVKLLQVLCPHEQLHQLLSAKPSRIRAMLHLLDWVYDTYFTEPRIPTFDLSGTTYHLPAAQLKYCHIIEWAQAETCFDRITGSGNFAKKQPDPTYINHLILTLCRPEIANLDRSNPHWDGDNREYFSPVLNRQRIALMGNLSVNFKCYFLLFYLGCKKHINHHFEILFEKPKAEQDGIAKYQTGFYRPMDFGWTGVIMDIAESGTFGKFEEVQYTNLYTILYYLSKKRYDYLEQQANAKKHANT